MLFLSKFSRLWKYIIRNSHYTHGLYGPWNSPGQNTGVDRLSLFQGIFPARDQTQVSHIEGGFFTNWTTQGKPPLLAKHFTKYFPNKIHGISYNFMRYYSYCFFIEMKTNAWSYEEIRSEVY